jgi:hypothetical protein
VLDHVRADVAGTADDQDVHVFSHGLVGNVFSGRSG